MIAKYFDVLSDSLGVSRTVFGRHRIATGQINRNFSFFLNIQWVKFVFIQMDLRTSTLQVFTSLNYVDYNVRSIDLIRLWFWFDFDQSDLNPNYLVIITVTLNRKFYKSIEVTRLVESNSSQQKYFIVIKDNNPILSSFINVDY